MKNRNDNVNVKSVLMLKKDNQFRNFLFPSPASGI